MWFIRASACAVSVTFIQRTKQWQGCLQAKKFHRAGILGRDVMREVAITDQVRSPRWGFRFMDVIEDALGSYLVPVPRSQVCRAALLIGHSIQTRFLSPLGCEAGHGHVGQP
jgi:hypothetical protein